ncbi:MAG: hypothetical protein [Olavius algarvensis Gamma 1 endosymbiont]|nr:MAG: hypothetical protein [Olavius algarvensis Gamma 1 endosymbiont]
MILRGLQSRQDAGAPSVPGSRYAAFQVAKSGNLLVNHLKIRVAPLDNFMIYKDIIRLDRPD